MVHPVFTHYLSVERRARVLLYPENVEVEGRLELGVRDVRLLESQTGGADESFVLRRLPCEPLADKGDLRRSIPVKQI